MSIKYVIKTHDISFHGKDVRYYSASRLDPVLATGEKFFVAAQTTHQTVIGATSLTVGIDISNDRVNWATRSLVIAGVVVPAGTSYATGSELGTTTVGGRFMRVFVSVSHPISVSAIHVEVWVCGRSLA